MKTVLRLLALASALALVAPARAASPFEVFISTSGPAIDPAGYGSFPDLLSDVLNANGHFSSLNGNNFTARVTFLGVSNAVIASSNASGTNVSLSLPVTGFNHSFTGATRAEVQDQIEDFFLKNV